MNIVLVAPEIAANTGNIARLCAATNATLHLIEPLGFRLNDHELKRAGMDYWQHVQWKVYKSWEVFGSQITGAVGHQLSPISPSAFWFTTSKGKLLYTEANYHEDDYLVFGRESVGLPEELLDDHEKTTIRIPMWNENARSLNLSNAVAIVLYEALRKIHKL